MRKELIVRTMKSYFVICAVTMLLLQSPSAHSGNEKTMELYNQSVGLIKAAQFAEAETVLKTCYARSPEMAEIASNYGLVLLKLGKLQEAKTVLLKGAEQNPNYDLLWLNLGLVQEALGDLVGAKKSFTNFVTVGTNNGYADKVRSHLLRIDELIASGATPSSSSASDYVNDLTLNERLKWAKSKMPLRIYIAPAGDVSKHKNKYDALLRDAIAEWSKALNGDLSTKEVNTPELADIVFVWVDSLESDAGGETRYAANANGLQYAQIVLALQDPSPTVKLSDDAVRWLSLNQFGHALGILGFSKNPKDIMYFSAPQFLQNVHLTERDINTVRKIYKNPLQNWMTVTEEALDLAKKERFSEALLKLQRASQLKKNNPMIRENLVCVSGNYANKLVGMGNFSEAEKLYKQALSLEKIQRDANLEKLIGNYCYMLEKLGRKAEIPTLCALYGVKVQHLRAPERIALNYSKREASEVSFNAPDRRLLQRMPELLSGLDEALSKANLTKATSTVSIEMSSKDAPKEVEQEQHVNAEALVGEDLQAYFSHVASRVRTRWLPYSTTYPSEIGAKCKISAKGQLTGVELANCPKDAVATVNEILSSVELDVPDAKLASNGHTFPLPLSITFQGRVVTVRKGAGP